jgi:hypothetical protein
MGREIESRRGIHWVVAFLKKIAQLPWRRGAVDIASA